jgi:hypothetical protein
MVKRIHQWISGTAGRVVSPRGIGCLCTLTLLLSLPVSQAAPRRTYTPRAHIADVSRSFVSQGSTPVSGAGLRFFQSPDSDPSGTERFEIHWYANSPGIPPGAILMLESQQERSASIKNYILRTTQKSEGNVVSTIEIPSEDIRQAGRTLKWRMRIIWGGRSLASRMSPNWES